MSNIQYMRNLIVMCLATFAIVPYSKATAQDISLAQSDDNAGIQVGLNSPSDNSSLSIGDHHFNRRKNVFSIGIGSANAIVSPNPDDEYNDGGKLNLGLGLSTEYALTPYFALTARADFFISFGYRLFSVDTSVNSAATAGFTLGKIHQPGQIYLTATAGPGFVVIGDLGLDEEGEQDCLLCTPRQGGASAGLATRLAIGRTGQLGRRIELVYMRNGGNGNNNDFPNNEEAFIESVLLQISSYI